MNSVLLLTRLQVKQALGGFQAAIEKRAGANGAMAGTALLGVMAIGGLGWLGYAAYGIVGGLGLDKVIYDILFMACGALTFVFSLPVILGTFFGSSDINDLLPLPVSPLSIVLAKALSSLAASYFWTFVFIAGPLAGWGLAAGAGHEYWVVYALAVLLTPLMPTAYAGTLSIIIATLFKRVRRKDAITTITTVLTLGVSAATYFVSNATRLSQGVEQMLGAMADSVGSMVMAFPAYGFAVYAFAHPDPLGTWLFVLLSLAAFAVFVLVACALYLRVVTSLSSGGGAAEAYRGQDAHVQSPVLKSLVSVEVHKVLRNSSVLLNYVAYPLVITPVLFASMFMTDSMGQLLGALSEFGDVSQYAGFALALAMLLAVCCVGGNKIAATGISREGSNWTHMKVIPVPMETQVLAKVLPGFAMSVLIVLVFMIGSGVMLSSKAGVSPLVAVSALLLMLGAAWLMSCTGAWAESRNPKVDWGNDGDVNVKSLGSGAAVLRSMLVGLVYSLLPLLTTPLVGLDANVFMPVFALAGIAVAVVLGRTLVAQTARNIEALE